MGCTGVVWISDLYFRERWAHNGYFLIASTCLLAVVGCASATLDI
jgi:hypothetical protein